MAKKIAFIHDLPLGGAFVAMTHLIDGLSKLGHTIDLYTLPDNDIKPFTSSINTYHRFSSPQKTHSYSSPLDRLKSDYYSIITEGKVEKRLAGLIDSQNYDLALVSHTRFLDAPHILRFLKTPSLYYTHGGPRTYYEYPLRIPENLPWYKYIYESAIRQFKSRLDRINANAAKGVVTTSEFAASTINMWYGLKPKTTGLGIDTDFFTPGNSPKKHQLLLVGNPEPQKAIDLAILALAYIKSPPLLVVACPRRMPTNTLQHLADTHGVKIKWLFGLSKVQIRKLYRQSLATLALSYREHFGFSVVESLACATPVIAVKDGAFTELVQNNKSGYTVIRDPNDVATAITKVIDNPQIAQKLGQYGSKWVTKNYRWADAVNKLDRIIQDL